MAMRQPPDVGSEQLTCKLPKRMPVSISVRLYTCNVILTPVESIVHVHLESSGSVLEPGFDPSWKDF